MSCVRRDRVLTTGVQRVGGELVHKGWDVSIPDDTAHGALATDLGLVSTVVRVKVGPWWIRLPPWWHSAARSLPAGCGRAVVASMTHNVAGMAPLVVLALISATVGSVTSATAFLALGTVALVCLGSVLIHEAGHVAAFRILLPRDTPGILVVRGLSCRLVRPGGGSARDAAIVAAGAAAPVVVAAMLVPVVALAPLFVAFAVMVALAHAAALLIPVGDGAALRSAMRALRRSEPIVTLEDRVEPDADAHHEQDRRRISPRESELRHRMEVHAVDTRDEGGGESDGGPR